MGSRSGTMLDEVLRAHGAVPNDESQLRRPAERPLSVAFAVLNVHLIVVVAFSLGYYSIFSGDPNSSIPRNQLKIRAMLVASKPFRNAHIRETPPQENCQFTRRGIRSGAGKHKLKLLKKRGPLTVRAL
jgi:hypothetical protein